MPREPRATGLTILSPREASIFACVVDTYCAPAGAFPPVRETDAAFYADELMACSPRLNRAGFRAMLHAVELAPLATPHRARLRRLAPEQRREFALGLDRSRHLPGRALGRMLKLVATLAYYGDEGVLASLGYDPEAKLARGRELRAREGRP
ncbi:MAG: hypothetical protein QOI98_163 [Solirubrobacteraceae bacterium]|nr:hypothetical protein [Solirubrobacteraceae bacterium]